MKPDQQRFGVHVALDFIAAQPSQQIQRRQVLGALAMTPDKVVRQGNGRPDNGSIAGFGGEAEHEGAIDLSPFIGQPLQIERAVPTFLPKSRSRRSSAGVAYAPRILDVRVMSAIVMAPQ